MLDYYVHESTYIDPDVQIGSGTKIWHFSHIQSGAQIGENCVIGQNVNVGNNVHIGRNCKIQNNVSIYEGVMLEDYVFCGPSMVFTNVMNPRCKYPQRGSEHYAETRIGEGASLGANCTIVCGNNIGKHAFVGAGAVVTKDVPDYALVVGSPARIIGYVSEAGERLRFDERRKATCPRTGIVYLMYPLGRGKSPTFKVAALAGNR
jgi:UDP-2-acetamido-3-amino-2,3-dideoxy-glucuronate N-acetyltransferase